MNPTGSSPQCLHFWYSMFGTSIGTLNVYISQNGSLPGYNVWTLSRNQGNSWQSGQVPFQSTSQFTVNKLILPWSPYTIVGDILFLPVDLFVCVFVCLFAPTFNICNNFCNIEDRNLIFGMHVYLMEMHILSGERSRSSFKVKDQIYSFKAAQKGT
ncbi:hypothetical protein DPMN_011683 [Dreissena polymorpha]|uniref:MAM domain-containing protein n=1 Tax=Dreissena polymorpha TaxID=45954 RepID=A0A9D4N4K2_DREPO|nr:hypothetical protein DPMN_011683 [Dreissena polymorpha]